MNEILHPLLLVLLAAALRAGEAPVPPADGRTLLQTIVDALAANRELRVRRLAPERAAAAADQAAAAWDPSVSAEAAHEGTVAVDDGRSRQRRIGLDLQQPLPTGTTLGLEASALHAMPGTPAWTLHAGVSVTQALLRGASLVANRASLEQARLGLEASYEEVRGLALAIVQQTEDAYWRLFLDSRRLAIVEDSLSLALRFQAEVAARVRLGALAASDQAAADAEVAGRQAERIDAEAARDAARLRLLDMLDRPGDGELHTLDEPDKPIAGESLETLPEHLQVGMVRRPDIQEAALRLRRGGLEVVRTRDGLLPRLELFTRLGRSSYAESCGAAIREDDGRALEGSVGLRFSHVLGNRAAEAAHRMSRTDAEELRQALANQRRLAELDIRLAWREVQRAEAQHAASMARATARAEALRSATAAAVVGRRSAYAVALAQRDLLQARLDAAQATVAVRTARALLYRHDGSLLQRRGVTVPGAAPSP